MAWSLHADHAYQRSYVRGKALRGQPRLRALPSEPGARQRWINTFKSHASSSVLRAANAIFNGNDVTLELVRPKSRAELTTALDCFIECANLGLRSWGGVEGSPATGRGVLRDRV